MAHIGFFQESPDNNSITRVIFFVGIIWAILITTFVVITTSPNVGEIVALISGTTAPFLALKLVQKPMEVKDENPKKE